MPPQNKAFIPWRPEVLDPTQAPSAPVQQPFDMNAMLHAFLQMQQQQQHGQIIGQREALNPNVQLGRYGGRPDPTTGKDPHDPFSNGFFATPQQRSAIIASHQGSMPQSVSGNPYFNAWADSAEAPPPTSAPLPFDQIMAEQLPQNPATGMANPAAAWSQNSRAMSALKQQRAPRARPQYSF